MIPSIVVIYTLCSPRSVWGKEICLASLGGSRTWAFYLDVDLTPWGLGTDVCVCVGWWGGGGVEYKNSRYVVSRNPFMINNTALRRLVIIYRGEGLQI